MLLLKVALNNWMFEVERVIMYNHILERIKKYACSNRIALKYDGDELSYSELENTTNYIATKIREILKGDRQRAIIIYQKRGIKFVQYMIAVMKCNCYYVPVDSSVPVDRLLYMYSDIGAAMILSDEIEIDNSRECKVYSFDIKEYKLCNYKLEEIREDDLVYVMYTSGTSGNPKGVKIMYSNLINLIKAFEDILYHKFADSVNVGVLASFSFDSSVKQIYCALYYGHKLCIANDLIKNFGRKIHKFHVENKLTVCDVTPAHLRLMAMQKTTQISNVPYFLVGGENLRWEVLHKYVEFTAFFPVFIDVYGPTECCVDVAYKVIEKREFDNNLVGNVPIGKSIANTVLLIRDGKNIITENNVEGELCVRGKQVGAGYVGIESKSFTEIAGEREYRTGDIAYYNDEGDIVVVGRKDRQVKVNGFRIELDEISNHIESFLHVPSIVINYNRESSNVLLAFICEEKFDVDLRKELVEYLKTKIPEYMIPREYLNASKIPVTKNGKIDEKRIVEMYQKHNNMVYREETK